MGIIGGALYSCYNYFYVILNGGVGKNGSTVAVSRSCWSCMCVCLQIASHLRIRVFSITPQSNTHQD
ncbi:hypothetical protein GOODEAATRI_012412 [Goodea atripinnis]|uniref:Uncharacterized protein n=1 Tax=Goodea atripinnis TaxID=208336 RepID=A0ABV0NB20_9TELE